MDWFIWNGVKCTSLGIHVSQQPEIVKPSERATFTSVPGRSGSLTTLEGDAVYDDFILSVECWISNTANLPAICDWLRGSGKVTLACRPGGFYHARIVNQISFEQVLRGHLHRTFSVNFRCQPFWYVENVTPITLMTSGAFITNPGTVYSEPIITVYGSGEITLMVGMTITELFGISGDITLDTPLMEAYSGITSMNYNMSGDFPTLAPGTNAVSWSGNVNKIEIQPSWRYLV